MAEVVHFPIWRTVESVLFCSTFICMVAAGYAILFVGFLSSAWSGRFIHSQVTFMCAAVFLHSHDNMHMHCTLLLGSCMPTSGGRFLWTNYFRWKGFSQPPSCVRMCMCVHAYARLHVCVIACVHVCVCDCVCICLCVCTMCAYMHASVYVCTCSVIWIITLTVCAYMCMCTCMHYVCIHACKCVYVCLHLFTYLDNYTDSDYTVLRCRCLDILLKLTQSLQKVRILVGVHWFLHLCSNIRLTIVCPMKQWVRLCPHGCMHA